jgi:hypothetical protein
VNKTNHTLARIIIGLLIALSVGLTLTGPARAASEPTLNSWYYVGVSNKSIVYLRYGDLLEARATSRAARVWVKFDERKNPKVRNIESKVLYEFNCVAMTFRTLSATLYYQDGSNETDDNSMGSTPIVPDSLGASLADLLCTDRLPEDLQPAQPTPARAQSGVIA